MSRLLKTLGPAVFGLAMIVAGFFYDVLFAGIPYQDPTPELMARWEFRRSVAGWFYKIGGLVFLAGVIAIAFVRMRGKTTGSGAK